MNRPEYPRPQFVRNQWLNLNGIWDFLFDDKNNGIKNKWYINDYSFDEKINVPFAYQTKLSGIEDSSFHDHMWYKRKFTLNKDWFDQRIFLHFGAVDYRCWVYINGKYVGLHEGGHTSFFFDITDYLTWDEEVVVLHVEDPSTDETIPRGKQFWIEESNGIWYTRTSGVWQTVWIEPVNPTYISNLRLTPDVDRGNINLELDVSGNYYGTMVEIEIKFKDQLLAKDIILVTESYNSRAINLYNQYIFRTGFHHEGWNWTPENPNLFDINLKLKKNDKILDNVDSYFGMRKIHTEEGMVYLNNKPYYQKLVLDQGYWPDGLLTAPSDEDFKKDINLSREMGFNGCRKHQKVEDPRFLYWADKLGFLVWGECAAFPSYSEKAASRLTNEWIEIVERDYNHPSIVSWVPINESWGVPYIRTNLQQQHHSLTLYHLIHSLDMTRLVISNDGWELTETDICAIHNYNHGNEDDLLKYQAFKNSLFSKDSILSSRPSGRSIYANGFSNKGEPILLTEFGGIGFKVGDEKGWGYTSVKDETQFIKDYERIMDAVYASKVLHGFCYTQLTDVEQEINGLLTYDRKPKMDLSKIKDINNKWHFTTIDNN